MEITVTYNLDDFQVSQLKEISEKYKQLGREISIDNLFKAIMTAGSTYNIAEKIALEEWRAGIREEMPNNEEIYKETKERLKNN